MEGRGGTVAAMSRGFAFSYVIEAAYSWENLCRTSFLAFWDAVAKIAA